MTLINVADNFQTELISSDGLKKTIKHSTVYCILGNAWAAFFLSLVLNVVYHGLHPSQVDLVHLKEKFVVEMFGYEINIVENTVKGILFFHLKFYLAIDLNDWQIWKKKNGRNVWRVKLFVKNLKIFIEEDEKRFAEL